MTMAFLVSLQLVLVVSLCSVEGGSPLLTLSRPRRQFPGDSGCIDACLLPFPFKVCRNGGTCIQDCPVVICRCLPGFSGNDCGTRTTTTADSVNVTVGTTLSTTTPSQSPVDDNVTASTNSTSDVTPTMNVMTTKKTSTTPIRVLSCPKLLCVHGTCNETYLAQGTILCHCDKGWAGSRCELPCHLPCENGQCSIHEGREVCECEFPYKNEKNVCVIRPDDPEDRKWVGVVVACSVLLVVLLLLLILLPYWLWRKREIFIMKVVYFFRPYEDEDGKLFDAFVSYVSSPRDESFVYRRLYPKLEKEMGFKLCLHHRDFQVGETIANNIIWAVQNSRRTLLILSPDYLKSEFTRFEYQEAQREMLRLKHRIVPIMLDDVEPMRQNMDPTLKTILSSITYIRWPVQSPSENEQVFQLQALHGDAEEGFEKQLRKFWKRVDLSLPKKKRQPEAVENSANPPELQMSSPNTDGCPPSSPGSCSSSPDQPKADPSLSDKAMNPPIYANIFSFVEDASTPRSLEAMAKNDAGPIEVTYL